MRVREVLLLVPFLAACARSEDAATTSDSASGVAAATSATDAGAVRQAIDAANTKFVEAMKRGDTVTIADNYTDDAVVMPQGTESWRGREAIRKGFGGMLSQATLKEFSMKTEDIAIGGDLAVETGSYEETAQPKAGGKEVKDKGKYVVLWKRQPDGSWKIVRDIFNSDNPLPKS